MLTPHQYAVYKVIDLPLIGKHPVVVTYIDGVIGGINDAIEYFWMCCAYPNGPDEPPHPQLPEGTLWIVEIKTGKARDFI